MSLFVDHHIVERNIVNIDMDVTPKMRKHRKIYLYIHKTNESFTYSNTYSIVVVY